MIDDSPPAANWQAGFLTILPEIEAKVEFCVQRIAKSERDEARQSVLVSAALAYARLAERGRVELAYPGPLAAYGFRQYCVGRLVGNRTNSRDVGSRNWRYVNGRHTEPLDDLQETLAVADQRRATPADIAALRIDFNDWLTTLSDRDQQITRQLARGEETRGVARMFRISAGRVSQLRRELCASWQQFCGESFAPST